MFKGWSGRLSAVVLSAALIGVVAFSLPTIASWSLRFAPTPPAPSQFPVSVDPATKTIVDNAQADALFAENPPSPFQAAAANAGDAAWNVLAWLASAVSGAPWYQSIASVAGMDVRLVTIDPGMRKEQVADAFAKALDWNDAEKEAFLTPAASSTLPLAEGSFAPGSYAVVSGTTPDEAQALVDKHFTDDVLDHYGTATAAVVPLDEALTIASLIQREASGPGDMRIISGIIWNRLFAGMKLQIDATVQYAKADNPAIRSWWPAVLPRDLYSRKSPYNTYLHQGLPPTPIANPSVAAVLAALNPVKTSCMYYFHDDAGRFHCADTYAEHVALLKQYFGRGK